MTATLTAPHMTPTEPHGLRAWFRRHFQTGADGSTLTHPDAAGIAALEHALAQTLIKLQGAEDLIEGQYLRINELQTQVAQAKADHVDHGVYEKQLAEATDTIEQLGAENRKLRSEIENLGSITVSPMYRDTAVPPPVPPLYAQTLADLGYPADDPDVETTQQIPVSTLAQAAVRGAL